MKKILSLTLAMLMVLSVLAACSKNDLSNSGTIAPVETNDNVYRAEGEHNDQFYYDYVNGDEVIITGFAASHVPHAITVPSVIDDRPVTEIKHGAFKNKTNITEVTLPDTLTKIDDMAFANCTALSKINLPAVLRYLGEGAFTGTALTSVTIPSAAVVENEADQYAVHVGAKAFYNCRSLVSAVLPAELKVIPSQLFSDCVSLTTVTMGAAVEKIEAHAFSGCTVLTGLTLPATVTEIGDYAFAQCTALATPLVPNTVKVGTNAFYGTVALQ